MTGVTPLLDAARLAAARGDTETLTVTTAGLTLRVQVVGERLQQLIVPGLFCAGAAQATEPIAELWAFDSASSGVRAPPPPFAVSDLNEHGGIAGLTEGPVLGHYDAEHQTFSLFDERHACGVQWGRDIATMSPWESGAPLRHLVRWALAVHDAHVLHAAAVGTADGGVMLCGASGAGKSTTALACWLAGMALVTDDYCVVRTDDVAAAHAVFSVAKASPETLALLPALADRARDAPRDWRDKRRMAMGDALTPRLPLHAIVLPRIAPQTGAPVRLRPAEALRRVAEATLPLFPSGGRRTLRAVADLVTRLPAYELAVGPDVDRIPDAVAATIAQAAVA